MVMIMAVKIYIMGVQNLCWFHSLTCIQMRTVFSVGNSRSSSCPAYTILLTTYLTDYCSKENVNDFVLRRMFYSKQSFKNACYSSA